MVISARQAFRNVAALQLARPPDRSVPLRSTRGLVRSSLLPIRYLLSSRVCYPADWPIAGTGLAPVRKAALSAAPGLTPTGRLLGSHPQDDSSEFQSTSPTSSPTGIARSLPRRPRPVDRARPSHRRASARPVLAPQIRSLEGDLLG
jgi:hypothetical protein